MATNRKLYEIAEEINAIWSGRGNGVNFAAEPYLAAMFHLKSIDDTYGADDARYIVRYFLNNARSFTGPDAQRIKAELRSMLDK
jgi:hypothetical protein